MHTLNVEWVENNQFLRNLFIGDQALLVFLYYLTELAVLVVSPRVAMAIVIGSDHEVLSKADRLYPDFGLRPVFVEVVGVLRVLLHGLIHELFVEWIVHVQNLVQKPSPNMQVVLFSNEGRKRAREDFFDSIWGLDEGDVFDVAFFGSLKDLFLVIFSTAKKVSIFIQEESVFVPASHGFDLVDLDFLGKVLVPNVIRGKTELEGLVRPPNVDISVVD